MRRGRLCISYLLSYLLLLVLLDTIVGGMDKTRLRSCFGCLAHSRPPASEEI